MPRTFDKLRGWVKPSSNSTANTHRLESGNLDALVASSRAIKQNEARGQEETERTRHRDRNRDQTPKQANFETEEARRFQNLVWSKIGDPFMLGLRQDDPERLRLNHIVRIAYRQLISPIDELVTSLEDEERDLEREREEMQENLKSLAESHTKEIAEQDSRHAQALSQAKEDYQRETSERRLRYRGYLDKKDDEIEDLNLRHQAEIRALDERLAQMKLELEKAEKDKDDRVKELEDDHAVRIEDLEHRASDRAAEYEDVIEIMKNQHNDALTELKVMHKIELDNMVTELRGLNNVLRKRDNVLFVASSLSDDTRKEADEQIKLKFSEIVQIVDELGRLVWKPEQKIWTDELIRKVGADENQRLLKKWILQDSIWTMLHLYIFCSPFRMFGKEGETLENEWNHHFGEDHKFDHGVFTWPVMSIEAERWRYITIKECRKALMEALPSQYDPRIKLKKGFMATSTRLVLEIKSLFDEMVEYTSSDVQQIEQLVTKLANVWLEYGMHRCRFILFMASPDLRSTTEKARQVEEGSLVLTRVPGLRRHGDVDGVELASSAIVSSTIVGGLEGEFFEQSRE